MSPLAALGVRIQIPAEAVVPLLIAVGVVLVLVFAGSALKAWKDRHPGAARIGGILMAVALLGGAGYLLGKVLIETRQNDPVYKGIVLVGFLEGPLAGFFGSISAILWRFASQRWIALATGLGIGVALFMKPLAWPLMYESYDGHMRQWGLLDPEHLAFLGPGIVAVIVGLVVGLRAPRVS